MQYTISYYDIDHGGGLFAFPEFTRSEVVEADSRDDLVDYITKQKDLHGHHYRREKSFGFDYISNQGAVKVRVYAPPRIKKIKKI
jgi:hypothetical protein